MSVTVATTGFRSSPPRVKSLAVFNNKESRALFSPYGLCIDSNNILYVADKINNTVCVYNTSGQFLGYSDGSSFDHPCFIVSESTDCTLVTRVFTTRER